MRSQNIQKQNIFLSVYPLSSQGLEGVLRGPGFGRNQARDSGIQKKPSRDS